MSGRITDIEAIFQFATDRAICVREDEHSQDDVWLPLSQVDVDAPKGMVRGAVVTITGPEWLLIERGLL